MRTISIHEELHSFFNLETKIRQLISPTATEFCLSHLRHAVRNYGAFAKLRALLSVYKKGGHVSDFFYLRVRIHFFMSDFTFAKLRSIVNTRKCVVTMACHLYLHEKILSFELSEPEPHEKRLRLQPINTETETFPQYCRLNDRGIFINKILNILQYSTV
jgi:hypothetical protein